MTKPATLVAALCLLAPASAGAGGSVGAALSASPSRIGLDGSARQAVRLTNPGSVAVDVVLSRGAFALDLRGRPHVSPSTASTDWLTVSPRHVRLAAGRTASVTISSRVPKRAQPGDHPALVLLTTRPTSASGVAVLMRLGVVVTVRAPGVVVHRLALTGARLRPKRRIVVHLANRGNVTESLTPGRLSVTVERGGRVLQRLRVRRQDLLPHTRGIVELRPTRTIRGRCVVVVRLDGRLRRFAMPVSVGSSRTMGLRSH